MSVTLGLSVDGLTVQSAWMAALAVVALVLLGWRQPARTRAKLRRASRDPQSPAGGRADGTAIYVERRPTELYRAPGPLRRLLAAIAGGGVTAVTGAVIAVVLAFAVAFAVITLTGLLK